jgi:hypothetical protein
MANTFKVKKILGASGFFSSSVEAPNLVYNTGNQTVSGVKTFATGIDIFNGTSPQSLRIFNTTGTNSGEFGVFGWRAPNALVIGAQATQSGILRDVIITGNSINIQPSGGAGITVDSRGRVTIRQNGVADYTNSLEVRNPANNSSYFTIRDDGATTFSLGGNQACWFGGSISSAIKNGGIVTANGGFLGFSNSADPANYLNEHTVRLYRGHDFVLDLRNATYPTSGHQFRVFNITGTNTGEFGVFGWVRTGVTGTPNALVIGTQASQSGALRDVIITGNNININGEGAFNIFDNTNLNGNLSVSGNTTITGHLAATSKSFLINHPTQTGKKLQYGSLESPYHGIRLTDKGKINSNFVQIDLPEYISALVLEEGVNIQLTNINHSKVLFVKKVDVSKNYFEVGLKRSKNDKKEYEFYWSFTAERKDIPKLETEF